MILFFKEHGDTIKTLLAGGGGFGVLMTNMDLVLKVLIGVSTFIYVVIKTAKEIKKWK